MIVQPSQAIAIARDQTDAAGLPAANTHTATLWKNGATTAVSVAITNPSTGVYKFAWTIPADAAQGDVFSLRVVDGDGYASTVWEGQVGATGLTIEQADTLDSIAVALAGSAPVEPTGTTVFEHLEQIQDSIDAYIASVTAVNGSSDTIVGFPATLTIGNSYTTDGGNAIHVFIRDENDDPIAAVGAHDFTDPDFSCDLIITNSGNAGRVRATVTYVDPGAAESYLKVEIPLSESSRAAAGAATMQCTLKWDGVAKTIATQTVTWVARI